MLFSEELIKKYEDKILQMNHKARENTLSLPLKDKVLHLIYEVISHNEMPLVTRQQAFWLIGYLFKNDALTDYDLLIKHLEQSIEEKGPIQDYSIRMLRILSKHADAFCSKKCLLASIDLVNHEASSDALLVLIYQVFNHSSRLDDALKAQMDEALFRHLNNPGHLDLRFQIAAANAFITQDANKANLLIAYLEEALIEPELDDNNILGLNCLLALNDTLAINRRSIDILCAMIDNNQYPYLHAASIKLITQSIHNNNDTLSDEALKTLTDLLKKNTDTEVIHACLKLIDTHINACDEPHSLPQALILQIQAKAQEEAFAHEALNICARIGIDAARSKAHATKTLPAEEHLLEKEPISEKDIAQLLCDLEESNQNNSELLALIQEGQLKQIIESIDVCFTQDSSICPQGKPINQWGKTEFLQLAKCIQDQHKAISSSLMSELLAVMKQAVLQNLGYAPRHAQFLSLLLMLHAPNKGRLAQIATGEGKSLIVVLLALIKVLEGKPVDIITSSSILASRDAAAFQSLYTLFGVTASCNADDTDYDSGLKPCYSADVVYGAISDFQFDLLRHDYQSKGTRGERPFRFAIVDEVDNMLVDECGAIARLSTPIPAMDHLEPLLVFIWDQFLRVNQQISLEQGQYVYRPPHSEKPIPLDNREEFVNDLMKRFIIKLMHSEHVLFPRHLKRFVESQVDNWSRAATIAGLHYELNKEYIITQNDKDERIIAPVDYQNTGVIHPDTSWSDGLHQFLQIKHGLKITPEQLMTCFISNVGFLSRYGNALFGLTGTIGEDKAQKLLQHIYPIDIVFMPTFKPKQFTELPAVLVDSEEEWLEAIARLAQKTTEPQGAMLLLLETIKSAQDASDTLKNQGAHRLLQYLRDDESDRHSITHPLQSQEIIISTNLAGRGTDIKTTSCVEQAGGLYVCLGFLPNNYRVEQQALGRTSRQGNKGMGQLVINRVDAERKLLAKYPRMGSSDSIDSLRQWRDRVESARLDDIKNHQLEKIRLQDALCSQFYQLMHESKARGIHQKKLDEAEERWGLWLKITTTHMNAERLIDKDAILDDFKRFRIELIQELNEPLLKNPWQLIHHGNDEKDRSCLTHLEKNISIRGIYFGNQLALPVGTDKNQQYRDAIKHYTQAIESEPIFSVQAYYNRAHTQLLWQSPNYQREALDDLLKAKSRIEDYLIPQLRTMHVVYCNTQSPYPREKDLTAQISAKINLLTLQLNYINQALGQIQTVLSHPEGGALKVPIELPLTHFFSDSSIPQQEIWELQRTGLKQLFTLDSVLYDEDFDLSDLLGGIMVASLQVIVGACAAAMGHPYLATFFIEEGIGDLIYAAQSAIDGGEFNWKHYRVNKITSCAFHIVTMGIEVMKERLSTKAASKITHAAANKATQSTLINKISQESMREMIKEKIVTTLISSGAKATINAALGQLSRQGLRQLKPQMQHEVERILFRYFNQPEVVAIIDTLLSMDSRYFTHLLHRVVSDLTHPRVNPYSKIGVEVLKHVLAQQHAALNTAIGVMNLGKSIDKIIHLTERFCRDFNSKLHLIAHQTAIDTHTVIKDHSAARKNLVLHIAESLTSHIQSCIEGSIINPAVNAYVSPFVDSIAAQINAARSTHEVSIKPGDAEKTKPLVRKERVPVPKSRPNPERLHKTPTKSHKNQAGNHSISLLTAYYETTRFKFQGIDILALSKPQQDGSKSIKKETTVFWRYLDTAQQWMNRWQISERAFGALQCVGGVAQIGVGIAGGVLSAETGVGPYLGASLAAIGTDDAYAGCTTLWTGVPKKPLLNQSLQGLGFSAEQADIAALFAGASPLFAGHLKQFGHFNKALAQHSIQEAKTYIGLRHGNFFARPIVFNARSSKSVAEAVVQKIDPKRFNSDTHFGPALYVAQDGWTGVSELLAHKTRATHAIRYQFNDRDARMLDFAQSAIAKEWGYSAALGYTHSKKIAQKAKEQGFNCIRYHSLRRDGGINIAILDDFEKLLRYENIVEVPKKQPARFSGSPWHK